MLLAVTNAPLGDGKHHPCCYLQTTMLSLSHYSKQELLGEGCTCTFLVVTKNALPEVRNH